MGTGLPLLLTLKLDTCGACLGETTFWTEAFGDIMVPRIAVLALTAGNLLALGSLRCLEIMASSSSLTLLGDVFVGDGRRDKDWLAR